VLIKKEVDVHIIFEEQKKYFPVHQVKTNTNSRRKRITRLENPPGCNILSEIPIQILIVIMMTINIKNDKLHGKKFNFKLR